MRKLSTWPCCYIKRLPKMENWEIHCNPQIYRKDYIRRHLQMFTTLFRPIKWFICNCTQTPLQSSRPLPHWARKIRLPIDFKPKIEYLKYISNYCLTRLDTLDEITPENPVPRDAPSSDETPTPPQTTPEQPNETTIQNIKSILQSAASNDDEMEINTGSIKRPIHEDSSEEEPTSPLPSKRTAPGSPTSGQNGTVVPKGTGRGDLSKISTSCLNAPKLGRGGGWSWR